MANISNAHDTFVRSLLADKQLAIDYFKSALPAHIADKLDFTTLKPLPGTYVSKELKKTLADVVYTCQRKDRRGSVKISLLLEHKSAPDKYTPVQIGGYLFSGYQQQIQQRSKQLSPIIPVLFYHGEQKWEYWTLDRLFDGLDQELLGYIPKYEYVWNNLTNTSDDVVRALGNQFLASSLLMLKHYYDKAWLEKNFLEVLMSALSVGSDEQQVSFLIYSFVQLEYTDEQIAEIIKELPLTIKDKVMSTYDLIYEKGRNEERALAQRLIEQERAKAEQERARAYAEKLKSALEFKKMGLPVGDIAKGLQLSIEEVEKL